MPISDALALGQDVPFRGDVTANAAFGLRAPRTLGSQAHAIMTIAVAAVIVYASLFPFNFESRSLSEAATRFERGLATQPIDVGDFAGNVLLFLPLGYVLLGTLRVDRPGGSVLATASILGLAAGLSVTVEFLQAFFPPRTPCLNDVFAQVLGACVGAGVWQCAGHGLTARARHVWFSRDLRDHAPLLLIAYTATLVVLTLLPFRLDYRPELLGFKVNGAFYRMMDLDVAPIGGAVYLWKLLLLLPAGVLAAFVRRDVRHAAKLGFMVIGAVASAELMVRGSRYDFFDLAVAIAAFSVGWLQGRSMAGGARVSRASATTALAVSLGVAWLAAATALIHGEAFDFTDNPTLLLDRMGTMNWWPLNDIYGDNYLRVLRTALRQGIVFMVGGGILALGARRALERGSSAPAAAIALGTALILEVGQLTHPNLTPSVTAILWQATGAWLGFLLVCGLMPARTGGGNLVTCPAVARRVPNTSWAS
jgi:VanZ family protein